MSETKDVRIPRELYDFLLGAGPLEGCWFGDRPDGAKGIFWWRRELGKCTSLEPAPKPAGGETAWCQPMRNGVHASRKFIVRFEDADRGDAVFDDEPEARAFWEKANTNWNCYLFGAMPLAAAPPAPAASPSGGEVRPLVWEAREDIPGLHNALGKDGWWRNIKENSHGRFEYEGDTATTDYNHRQIYSTLSEAKAAAQADYERRIRSALTSPEAPQASEVVRELVEALEWYGEQSRLCRLIHSGGDAGRHALAADGGKRAKAALAKIGGANHDK